MMSGRTNSSGCLLELVYFMHASYFVNLIGNTFLFLMRVQMSIIPPQNDRMLELSSGR